MDAVEATYLLYVRIYLSSWGSVPTMHAKEDTELLESLWSDLARVDADFIPLQILDDFLDFLHVFGVLGIICPIPLFNLAFF